jgi:hypothetical protein
MEKQSATKTLRVRVDSFASPLGCEEEKQWLQQSHGGCKAKAILTRLY